MSLPSFCSRPSETCSLLIDTYIKDSAQREYLFDAMETIPCVVVNYARDVRTLFLQGVTEPSKLAAVRFVQIPDIMINPTKQLAPPI
ncbi:hypothetical protein EV702DRAFT_1205134 [Suillus placidus]|uniref:Uncharacterized protein n=1 Tax=Suillus placidus TaxID=48579 RepID=A0A9P6ZFX0_9AGAM|nr:hypothetical protein EV702DRAFT_1205134 [Suillus placidus]